MKFLLPITLLIIMNSGCAATWHGVQQDTTNAAEWSKEKVHQGATYVKEKTE
ncbi:MAG: hypothetical protein PHO27_03650 [Sulfuricurvum sp.]|nr:hypothetical protein [Sulfuricurvum sp.]